VWDIGGQRAIREYWQNYYAGTDALIYVVDSSDEQRTREIKENLDMLMGEADLAGVPLLVYANKQDLGDLALSAEEIMENLQLSEINNRKWNIQACSATTQEGLSEGISWVIETLNEKNSAAAGQ
jgi:ADP-ribosylation factor-like protein 3